MVVTENPNAPDNNGWAPIHCAIIKGYTEIVKLMAPNVEKINAPMPIGYTPLYSALRDGFTEIVKLISSKVKNYNV